MGAYGATSSPLAQPTSDQVNAGVLSQTLRMSSRRYVTQYVGEVSVPQFASELSSLKRIENYAHFSVDF